MNIANIINALKQETERINSAISALEGGDTPTRRRVRAKNGRRKRRRLSAVARKRISEAAKARWARAKKAGRKTL